MPFTFRYSFTGSYVKSAVYLEILHCDIANITAYSLHRFIAKR